MADFDVSSSTPTRDAIDSLVTKGGGALAFMLFNIEPQVSHQFLGKDNEAIKELWMQSNKGIIEPIRL